MKKRCAKKGFTLIELVVTIAVISILACVSVATYFVVTNSAKESNDISLTKQMNDLLSREAVNEGKNKTAHDAVLDLKDGGFDITKLTPTTEGYEFVYDVTQDKFFLLDGVKVVAPVEGTKISEIKTNVFKFVGKGENLSTEYSNYLKDDFEGASPLIISTGLDVGTNNKVTDISYVNATKKDVTIRTNGGTLTIDGIEDTVKHYGEASVVNVKKVANNSYHEFGKVASLNVKEGRVVAEPGSKISEVMITHDAVVANVKIESTEKNSIESIVDCTNKLPEGSISGSDAKPMVGKVVSTLGELDAALWPSSGQPASYVVLKNDIDMTGTPLATKSKLVLNGNGFTLKGKRPTSTNVLKKESTIFLSADETKLESYDVTFKNITIQNTSSVQYASAIGASHFVRNLTLSNVKIINTATNGYGLRFGGNTDYSSPELTLNLDNVDFSMAKNGYSLGIERKTTANIKNTSLSGFASLVLKDSAKNSIFNIRNSKLLNENNMEGEANSYGCIVSETNYIHVNVENSYINTLVNKPSTFQYAFLYRNIKNYTSGDIKFTISNNSIVDGKVFGAVGTYNDSAIDVACKDSKFTQNIEDVQMKDKDGYVPSTHKVVKEGIYYKVMKK